VIEELPVQVEGLLGQIADLPAKQAQAIAAVYVAQLSVREAAAVVGCSESTLRTHLQRGRGALRKIYLKTEHQR
jgi:DNA-directed RNA polymerase specialized sigma24 family protein